MSLIQKLPHRRMEAWRWTDVQRAVPDGMTGQDAMALTKAPKPFGPSGATWGPVQNFMSGILQGLGDECSKSTRQNSRAIVCGDNDSNSSHEYP